VPSVACHVRPPHVVSRACGIASGSQTPTPRQVALAPDGEQSNGGTGGVRQVALAELREGSVGSPLQRVVEVISRGRGEPSVKLGSEG
jgi:hypothetical protein